jgi:hypothetical protein
MVFVSGTAGRCHPVGYLHGRCCGGSGAGADAGGTGDDIGALDDIISFLNPFSPGPLTGQLTVSQQEYINNLKLVEQRLDGYTPVQQAFILTYLFWPERFFNSDGSSSFPVLLLRYIGPRVADVVAIVAGLEREFKEPLGRLVVDFDGRVSGVTHAFAAVATYAGRRNPAGLFGVNQATSGGDFLQNVQRLVVGQGGGARSFTFRASEERDNNRGRRSAFAYPEAASISERITREFYLEND